MWLGDDGYDGNGGQGPPNMGVLAKFKDKERRPLTRKVSILTGILNPYSHVKGSNESAIWAKGVWNGKKSNKSWTERRKGTSAAGRLLWIAVRACVQQEQ